MSEIERCVHARLHMGSGGFYIWCADCGHEWLCSKHNEGSGCATPSRGDFDCQTPLATPSCETIWTANLSDATAAPHGVGVK